MPPQSATARSILSVDDWLEQMRPQYLTIGDVLALKKGAALKCLCVDRNFYDLIDSNEENVPTPPAEFCSGCYLLEYVHGSGLHGSGGIRTRDCPQGAEPPRPFNFELNYRKGQWYPLNRQGKLPTKDPQQLAHFQGVERDFRKYPRSTCVGWRGPMLRWDAVAKSKALVYQPTRNDDGSPLPMPRWKTKRQKRQHQQNQNRQTKRQKRQRIGT